MSVKALLTWIARKFAEKLSLYQSLMLRNFPWCSSHPVCSKGIEPPTDKIERLFILWWKLIHTFPKYTRADWMFWLAAIKLFLASAAAKYLILVLLNRERNINHRLILWINFIFKSFTSFRCSLVPSNVWCQTPFVYRRERAELGHLTTWIWPMTPFVATPRSHPSRFQVCFPSHFHISHRKFPLK